MFSKLMGSSSESKRTGPDVPSNQEQSVPKQPNSQLLELHSKQRNNTNVLNSCYNFVYLNIARLLLDNGKNKSKISFLADIFNEHTLFCGLCETFLHSDILDAEVSLHGYNISRCDRIDRIGGGVCFYIREGIGFEEILKYSNAVCEVLILKLKNPDLILINIYRPPNASCEDFGDVLLKVRKCMDNLPAPLSNIVVVGDFNFPHIDWNSINISCNQAAKLKLLTQHLFLCQYVKTPTRNENILDHIFSNDEMILTVETNETVVSDHNIINVETKISVKCMNNRLHNEPTSLFESIDYNTSDWEKIKYSLKLIAWGPELDQLNAEQCLQKISDTLYEICASYSKSKHRVGKRVNKYFKHRKTLMRKRCRLRKKLDSSNCDDQNCGYQQKIRDIEKCICESHRDEQKQDELRVSTSNETNFRGNLPLLNTMLQYYINCTSIL